MPSYPAGRFPPLEQLAIVRRLVASASLLGLSACASDPALRSELVSMREQLVAVREAQRRMEQRVERLEEDASVARVRRSTPSPAGAASPGGAPASEEAGAVVPELTVIKLRPRREPAPALDTKVAVVEPDPDAVVALVEPVSARAPAEEDEDPQLLDIEYDAGVSALRTGNVDGGVERLKRFATENPRHARADNALYFASLGLVGLGDPKGAAELLEGLVARYPAGDVVTDALLKLAECRLRLAQPADARAIYTRLVTAFPGTAAATQAEQRLAAMSRTP